MRFGLAPVSRLHARHALLLLLGVVAWSARAADGSQLVLVGTYTGHGSEGIYAYRFDPARGQVTALGLAATTANPSFLAADPAGRFVYAVNELDVLDGQPTGGVSAFAVNRATGALTFLGQVPSRGKAPAHLSVDGTGKYVLVANYDSGNVAVFPIGDDGRLGSPTAIEQHSGSGPDTRRQAGPHAHFVATDPGNRFVLSADLGTDRVHVSRFDVRSGTLTPNDPPAARVDPGSGPRHVAFSPSGKFVYLVSEMAGTVTVFAYDAGAGTLSPRQTISTVRGSLPALNRAAEILVHPGGKFLYVSNRGDATDDIVVFRIAQDGGLSLVQRISSGGRIPRGVAIDLTGKWLFAANHQSNDIQAFRIDAESGRLTPAFRVTGIHDPVGILFLPGG